MLPSAETLTHTRATSAARLRPLEHPALRDVGDADAVAARDAGQRGQQALQPVPVADLAHDARVLAQRGRVQPDPARAPQHLRERIMLARNRADPFPSFDIGTLHKSEDKAVDGWS
jgi:hypothetical protein